MKLGPFIRENAPWLAVGALLSFMSCFGQTFFIATFSGEIRDEFSLSLSEWGGIYTLGTGVSALVMLFAGGLADRFRIRTISIVIAVLLAFSCFAMAVNPIAGLLPLVIFALRFTGQGMMMHVALVAMARWFVATRGKALAFATAGFSLGEATLPLSFVWLKTHLDWHTLWVGVGVFCLLSIPVLLVLLQTERSPQSIAKDSTNAGMDGKFWTRRQALSTPLFWSIVPAIVLFPAFATVFWFQQVHFAEVKGWEHLSLVAVFPLGTGAFMLSTIAYGTAIDRFGCARLMPIYLLPLTLAFVLHWYAPSVAWSALGVVLMGIAGGGQATLPAACWAGFFGTRHIGAIKATVAALMVFGSAIGPAMSGWLIDAGFDLPAQYLVFAAAFLGASIMMIRPLKNAASRLPIAA